MIEVSYRFTCDVCGDAFGEDYSRIPVDGVLPEPTKRQTILGKHACNRCATVAADALRSHIVKRFNLPV